MPEHRLPVPETAVERIRVKRIYRAARVSDGKRILIDRLWPRGITRDRARLASWCREIAPSDSLRRWFHAHPDGWAEFEKRYQSELATRHELVRELAGLAREGIITLLFGAKDEEHNNAIALRNYIRRQMNEEDRIGDRLER
ncbi:DUF488 domain-containing protein [Seohaeicola zhoushanensis]